MLMQVRDGTTPEQIEAALDGLATMPGKIPGILRYEFGTDLGLVDGNPDIALVADFASEEDWRAYLSHPEHVALTEALFTPIKGTMTRVQYLVE
jgi:hypothetical protein